METTVSMILSLIPQKISISLMETEALSRRPSKKLGGLESDSGIRGLYPFVKWAGGKGSLLDYLLRFVPITFSRYYEPFLGGGALFFALCERTTNFRAYLSDTNRELIDSYKVVKSNPKFLIRSLLHLRNAYRNALDKEDYYYEIRSWDPKGPIESAARFIFLNKTCYNGLYRVNPRGEFNVPFGHQKNPRIFDEENLKRVSNALRKTYASLRAVKYQKAVSDCEQGDFAYLDPPYHPSSKTSSFTDYTREGFDEQDQRELAGVFVSLAARKCIVLLSNSDTPLVRQLYHGYRRNHVLVNRPINSVGTGRRGFRELVIRSEPAALKLSDF